MELPAILPPMELPPRELPMVEPDVVVMSLGGFVKVDIIRFPIDKLVTESRLEADLPERNDATE